MKAASVNEIKQQLKEVNPVELIELCLRLARFKKENKELLTYLLFEADDLQAYIANVKKTNRRRIFSNQFNQRLFCQEDDSENFTFGQ